MNRPSFSVASAIVVAIAVCSLTFQTNGFAQKMKAPVAKRKPIELKTHGHVRVDPYFWLNQREDQEVISYLEAENAYLKEQMKSTEGLQKKLFAETKSRIKLADVSVPYPENGFEYYSRTEEEKQYAIYCRKKTGSDEEQVILDVNELAKGNSFCSVRGLNVTTNTKLLAYAVDTVGRRKYNIRFKNLETGELLDDQIETVTGNMAWAEDNQTIFYARQDPQTLRSFRIYRHKLGTDAKDDPVVYEEKKSV